MAAGIKVDDKELAAGRPAGYSCRMLKRLADRALDALRPVTIDPGYNRHAEGSCLIRMGETVVLCTASVEEKPPAWLRGTGQGWVTAEYGMLPRATHERTDREAAKGRQSGRTQEIQRLIGRALRAVVDRSKLNEMQIRIDCDVLQADGGTRCASITGGYVALALACRHLQRTGLLRANPLREAVAAVSCGIADGRPLLDLDYSEDSAAATDANFVITATGALVEVQASAEGAVFQEAELLAMLAQARTGIAGLLTAQQQALAV